MNSYKETQIMKSFSKYVKSYNRYAFMQKTMGERLAALLPNPLPPSILEIGCGTGIFTRHLLAIKPQKLILNDLAPAMIQYLEEQIDLPENVSKIIGNAERIHFPIVQLIVANAVFQWFSSPDQSLKHLKRFLVPGGRMIFSTFGPQTLKELREIAKIVSPSNLLPHLKWKWLLNQAGLNILEAQTEIRKIFFPSALYLIKNLQQSGTAPLRLMEVGKLRDVIREYDLGFSTPQGVYASWEMFYFSVKKLKQ